MWVGGVLHGRRAGLPLHLQLLHTHAEPPMPRRECILPCMLKHPCLGPRLSRAGADGYSKRFGTVYVDYSSPNLDRYYKGSSMWLSNHFGLTSIRSAPSANDTCSTSSPPSPPAAAEPPAGAPGGAPAPAGGQPGRSPPPARDERTGS